MDSITSSKNQNKEWRLANICSIGGQKNGACEKYQINLIKQITQLSYNKSKYMRLNHRTLEFKSISNPMTNGKGKSIPNGFDWSEDFDGLQIHNNNKLYYNLKFVCGRGGAQTRTLKDVSSFIETQLKYIKKKGAENIIFINILDGNESFRNMTRFEYLLNLEDYKPYNSKCFVGDMEQFQSWFSKLNI